MPDPTSLELPEHARCAGCGYSIHGLKVDRCPECGLAFDRRAILARVVMLQRKSFDHTAKRMLSAPPWWATGAALLAIICNVNDDQVPSFPSVLLFATAAAAFLLRVLDRLRVSTLYDLTRAPKRRKFGCNWIVLPLALALASPSMGQNGVSLRLGFAASYIPMRLLAGKVIASQSSPPDQWLGCYHAVYICPTSDGMNFRLAGHKQSGFAYTTTGQPPGCRPWAEPLGGGWYFFAED